MKNSTPNINFYFIGISLFLFQMTFCQVPNSQVFNYNSDYNVTRRQVQKEYEAQADRNRQPNSPYVGQKGFSEQEKRELELWWNNATGKLSGEALEKRKKEIEAGSKAYREQQAIWQKKISDEIAQNNQDARPYKELLEQKGITTDESENLAKNYIWQRNGKYGKYGKEGHDFYAEVVEAGNYVTFFYQNYETADFDALKLCIDKLTEFGATITSNKLSKLLVVKYPNREADLDGAQIDKFKMFFDNLGVIYSFEQYYSGNNKIVIDDYFKYEAKNPKVNLVVLKYLKSTLPHDAYDMITEYYTDRAKCPDCFSGKIKREDRANFEKLMLQELKIKAINGIENCKINPYQLLLDQNKSNSNLFRRRYYDNDNGFTFIGYGSKKDWDFGIASFEDGSVFYGGFGKYNAAKGKCVFVYKNKVFYEGNMDGGFSAPTKKGAGKITFPNGYYLTANFKKDIPENASYFDESGNTLTKEEFEKHCDMTSVENREIKK